MSENGRFWELLKFVKMVRKQRVIARLKICGGINILTLTFNIKIAYCLIIIV
jgi:hypothetical protein